MRQSQVDKLYAGLKDLSEERRGKLDERSCLFQLNREVDDLEQWIAEREVVAGSHELGQDYEHVTVRPLTYILAHSASFFLSWASFGFVFASRFAKKTEYSTKKCERQLQLWMIYLSLIPRMRD